MRRVKACGHQEEGAQNPGVPVTKPFLGCVTHLCPFSGMGQAMAAVAPRADVMGVSGVEMKAACRRAGL